MKITIDPYKTKLMKDPFNKCTKLTHLVLANTVNTTDNLNNFPFIQKFTTITIPPSVAVIESNSFRELKTLVTVEIPYSITEIKSYAFYDCSSLKPMTIPQTVEIIGDFAFSQCTSSSVQMIGSNAFQGCSNLSQLILQSRNTQLGANATGDCPLLKGILYI